MEVSEHLSLIATGGSAGSVVVWDFELSKIDGVCFGHLKPVMCCKFIEPYPALITTSQDGIVCIWGV